MNIASPQEVIRIGVFSPDYFREVGAVVNAGGPPRSQAHRRNHLAPWTPSRLTESPLSTGKRLYAATFLRHFVPMKIAARPQLREVPIVEQLWAEIIANAHPLPGRSK